ncbi:thioredoxin [Candidatus Parcubacteria bacterium]|nr:thioredoxin [Candidatus Parcubacteria bacterium]
MQFTDQNFKQEVEENEGLILVDFSASWCAPCKLMEPIIEELIQEYQDKDIQIGSLDVEASQQTAQKYNIMGIPTIILFKHGKIIEQITGYQGKEALKQLIDKNS